MLIITPVAKKEKKPDRKGQAAKKSNTRENLSASRNTKIVRWLAFFYDTSISINCNIFLTALRIVE